jgi:hypothetical protein
MGAGLAITVVLQVALHHPRPIPDHESSGGLLLDRDRELGARHGELLNLEEMNTRDMWRRLRYFDSGRGGHWRDRWSVWRRPWRVGSARLAKEATCSSIRLNYGQFW